MVDFEEFRMIFEKSKDVTITEGELKKFYDSIIPSLVYFFAGRNCAEKLVKIEEECQWPVLKKIKNKKMDIYKGVDGPTLRMFINSIKDEEEVRLQKKFAKGEAWIMLRILIQARMEIYKSIFELSESDLEKIKKEAGKIKRRKLLKTIGVGAMIAGVIGTTYALFKNHSKK